MTAADLLPAIESIIWYVGRYAMSRNPARGGIREGLHNKVDAP